MLRNFLQVKTLGPLIMVLVLLPGQTVSQDKAVYWLRYQNQIFFKPELFWSNEVDNRRFFEPDVQQQFIFHSRLHCKVSHWDYAGGLTLSWAYASNPEEPVEHPVLEIRPVIEASHELPLGKIKLMNRLRLDNRFFEADKNESIFQHSTYVARIRYRLQALIPLHKNEKQENTITFRVADEIMFNHRSNVFDQNRIYGTFEFVISKRLSLESGYIYIYQQRFDREDFVTRHVIRFSVAHKLFLTR